MLTREQASDIFFPPTRLIRHKETGELYWVSTTYDTFVEAVSDTVSDTGNECKNISYEELTNYVQHMSGAPLDGSCKTGTKGVLSVSFNPNDKEPYISLPDLITYLQGAADHCISYHENECPVVLQCKLLRKHFNHKNMKVCDRYVMHVSNNGEVRLQDEETENFFSMEMEAFIKWLTSVYYYIPGVNGDDMQARK